jgi:hypothetical protein
MYLNTRMLNATTNSGWWNLITDAKMQFNITLNPQTLSKRGASTLRTWMRKGYNDRPTGRIAAYWCMLMHANGARYHMEYDRHNARVTLFDKSLEPRMLELVQEFKAFQLLANAAVEPEWHRQYRQAENIQADFRDDLRIIGNDRRSVGKFWFAAPMGFRVMRCDQFVEALGHPLPELKPALTSVLEMHSFDVEIEHSDYQTDRKRGVHTITRITNSRTAE